MIIPPPPLWWFISGLKRDRYGRCTRHDCCCDRDSNNIIPRLLRRNWKNNNYVSLLDTIQTIRQPEYYTYYRRGRLKPSMLRCSNETCKARHSSRSACRTDKARRRQTTRFYAEDIQQCRRRLHSEERKTPSRSCDDTSKTSFQTQAAVVCHDSSGARRESGTPVSAKNT